MLEIGDDNYTRRFGDDRVTRADIYDRPAIARRVHGDLGATANLPPLLPLHDRLPDAALHLRLRRAMQNLRAALRPGGVLLLTVPGISQIVREDMDREGDFWRFTTRSIADLAGECFDAKRIEVRSWATCSHASRFCTGSHRRICARTNWMRAIPISS